MAHEINESFCVYSTDHGGVPWHGIGTALDVVTADDVKQYAGFNRTIATFPIGLNVQGAMMPADQGVALAESIEGYRATVDLSSGRVLGVVSDRYATLQPQELLAAADFLVREFGAKYSLAAQLHSGRREIISLQLPGTDSEIAKGDTVKSYFNLANGHDGKLAVCVGSSDIRVVCQNTLTAWLNEGAVSIRHRGGVEKALAHAVAAFALETGKRATFYRDMAERVMMPDEIIAYYDACVGEAEPADAPAKRGRRSLRARLDDQTLIGVDLSSANLPFTLWGAYNAVTQLATHGTYAGNPLNALYFGGAGKLLERASNEAAALLAA